MTLARTVLVIALAVCVVAAAEAKEPLGDVEARYDAQGDALVIVRSGLPHQDGVRLAARRQQAEHIAVGRARADLTRFVDDALAIRAAAPFVAARVHRALDARTVGERYLADGSVVLRVSAPAAPLRKAWDVEGLPWVR